ncbi:hypothetical protein ACLOJK_026049 [Asimina triloba]
MEKNEHWQRRPFAHRKNLAKAAEEEGEEMNSKSSYLQQKQWELTGNSLPDDVALNIASFLQPSDVCALGSCSRFWRDLCSSDFLWISLSKQRWPSLDFSKVSAGIGSDRDSQRRFSSSAKLISKKSKPREVPTGATTNGKHPVPAVEMKAIRDVVTCLLAFVWWWKMVAGALARESRANKKANREHSSRIRRKGCDQVRPASPG